jgi:hypothetical protein
VSLSVIVAFRDDTPDQHRTRLWDFVRAKVERELPEAEIVVGTDGSTPFNKCVALNRAAAQARGDVLYILDADSWVDVGAVREAVGLIESGLARVKPWRVKLKLGALDTEWVLAHGPSWDGELPPDHRRRLEIRSSYQPAPPLLVARHAYQAVGGMDERFDKGWGGEDGAFWLALKAFFGPPTVLPGDSIHLYHPRLGRTGMDRWDGQESPATNSPLFREYMRASRSKDQMAELIASR